MTLNSIDEKRKNSPYAGSGALTREQFLFFEMRTTAKLMAQGLSEEEICMQIYADNLFQFPTEKSIKNVAAGCIRRLNCLNNEELVAAIANRPTEVAKQICLYAMMRQSRLVKEFMISVVGEKFRQKDMAFGQRDATVFLMRLQEQDDYIATWTQSTIAKIRQILIKVLVENDYLDNFKAARLNPVLLTRILEEGIRKNKDEAMFPAFNFFE